MLIGLLIAWNAYIRKPERRAPLRRAVPALHRFLSTNGISTRSTTCVFVRPSLWLGRLFWKRGDEGTIDRFGPDGAASAVRRRHPPHRAGPDRLSLHLCAGDAARPRRRGDLGDWGAMSGLSHPLASFALPLLGGDRLPVRQRQAARWIALLATLATSRSASACGHLRLGGAQWQFAEIVSLGGWFAWALGIDGIALMLIVLTVFLMPICIAACWAAIDRARARIYGRLPAHGDADARRVHGAGPVPLLHLLRGRPDPDVPDHRHLGRRRPHLRGLQILPLHPARLGADADRHAVDGE